MKLLRKVIATLLVVTMTTTSFATVFALDNIVETTSAPSNVNSTCDNVATDNVATDVSDLVIDESTNEVTSLRTAYEKHYMMSDGTIKAIMYTQPVQYQDESGDWNEIDNTLHLTYDKIAHKYIFTNQDNPFKVKFERNPSNTNETVVIEEDDKSISWSVQALNKPTSTTPQLLLASRLTPIDPLIDQNQNSLIDIDTPQKEEETDYVKSTSSILYEEAFENTDVEYTVSGSAVKEDIIINSPSTINQYVVTMNTGGLKPVLNHNNSISLLDPITNKVRFLIQSPYMYDANEEESTDIKVDLKQNGETCSITYMPNESWLNDESRAYPVTIDPTVTSSKVTTNILDTYVHANDAISHGQYLEDTMYIGNPSFGLSRAFIDFEVLPTLPTGATINKATLKCYLMGGTTSYVNTNIYKVDSFCDSTTLTWANHGAVAKTRLLYNVTPTLESGYYVFNYDTTSTVKSWYAGTVRYGFMINYANEAFNDFNRIYASETSKGDFYKPALIIDYTPDTAIPTLTSVTGNPTAWTNQPVKLTVNGATDNGGSGLNATAYSFSTTAGVYSWQASNVSPTYASNSTVYVYLRDKLGNLGLKQTVAITKIDKTIPTITSIANPSAWTNQSTTLTVNATDTGSGIKDYSFDNGVTWQTSNSKIYTLNTTGIIVKVRDNANNISAASSVITIAKIDKTLPVITSISGIPTAWTNQSVTLSVNATDTGSAIKDYSFDNGVTWQTSNSKVYAHNASGIIVKVRDNANNISIASSTINIATIDSTAPTITSITGNPTAWTNQSVTLTVNAIDSSSGIKEYSFDNGATWQVSNFKTYEVNTSGIIIKVKNNANNISNPSEVIDITTIDKTAPSVPVIYEQTGLFKLLRQDSSSNMEYKIDDGNWITYTESFEISRNKDVTISARSLNEAGTYSAVTTKVIAQTVGIYTDNKTDLSYNSLGTDLSFSRFYTSADNSWFFSLNSSVADYSFFNGTSTVTTPQIKIVTLPDGTKQQFVMDSNGDYKSTDSHDSLSNVNGTYILTSNGTTFSFGEGGYLESMTDNNNNQISIVRTASAITLTDSVGRVTTATLNASGQISQITDPLNRTVSYDYDSFGKLMSVTDVLGAVTSYNYIDGHLTTSGDYTIGYTGNRVRIITHIDGSKIDYTYDDSQNKVSSIDSTGKDTSYGYNNKNQILIYIGEDRIKTEYTYNENGDIFSKHVTNTDESTASEYYTYDENGNIITITYSDETTAEYIYDRNNLIREKSKENQYTYYLYDANGNRTTTAVLKDGESPPDSYSVDSDQTLFDVSTYTYDVNGTLQKDGDMLSYGYDAYGNQSSVTTKETDENNVDTFTTVTYTYDILGRMLSETIDGKTTTYTYNTNGQKLTTETQDGKETNEYNVYGQLVKNDVKGKIKTYTYNTKKQLVSSTDTFDRVTTYSYDEFGNLETQKFDIYSFKYQASGEVTSVDLKGPNSTTNMVTYQYSTDVQKLLSQTTYGNGQTISYTYSNGKVASIKFNDDITNRFEYSYDEAGELSGKIDFVNQTITKITPDEVIVYAMDETTILHSYKTTTIENNEDTTEDDTTTFTETIGGVDYAVEHLKNTDKFVKSLSESINKNFTYDDNDKLTGTSIVKQINDITTILFSTSYGYTGDLVTSLTSGSIGLSYTYDANDNIETVTQNGVTTKYYYDANSQLLRVNDGQQNKTFAYTYDARGNILTKSEYAYTTEALGTAISTINYTYGDTEWPDKLTSYDGKEITYDTIGNRTSYDGYTYVWEAGRQLKRMTKDGSTIDYKYDDSGIRQSKTVNGVTTNFTTIGGKITSQNDGTDSLYFRYDKDDSLIGVQVNGAEYLYIKNLQGDIISIIDYDGNVVVNYTYDSFGKVVSITGSLGDTIGQLNPMRYRGYYYDSETGFYYLQSRYYDAEMQRFINADDTSVLQLAQDEAIGTNLFAYCFNNPVMNIDPNGDIAFIPILIGIGIGALIGALAGWGYAKYFKIPKEKTWKYILGGALIGAVIGGCIGYAIGASAGSGAALWSGGLKNMGAQASKFAAKNGLKTIQQTMKGRLLNVVGKFLPKKIMTSLWDTASAKFLIKYAGTQTFVHVFITADAYKDMMSTFSRIEMATVAELGLKIIWHFYK